MNEMELDYRSFFKEWKNWDVFEPSIDGINGVYAFRLKKHFGRLKGESSILYIGQVEHNPERNKRPGIWHRLMNYRQNNKGASERLKEIEAYFGGRQFIEYAYQGVKSPISSYLFIIRNS
jgi:hypothetical protein